MNLSAKLSGRTIMLVEDEFAIAIELEDELLAAGAKVSGPFARTADGVDALDQARPDAAILDVALPDGEVFPVAERLRDLSIPFVFYTAHAEREDLRDRFGEVIVCRKPVPATEIREHIERLIN